MTSHSGVTKEGVNENIVCPYCRYEFTARFFVDENKLHTGYQCKVKVFCPRCKKHFDMAVTKEMFEEKQKKQDSWDVKRYTTGYETRKETGKLITGIGVAIIIIGLFAGILSPLGYDGTGLKDPVPINSVNSGEYVKVYGTISGTGSNSVLWKMGSESSGFVMWWGSDFTLSDESGAIKVVVSDISNNPKIEDNTGENAPDYCVGDKIAIVGKVEYRNGEKVLIPKNIAPNPDRFSTKGLLAAGICLVPIGVILCCWQSLRKKTPSASLYYQPENFSKYGILNTTRPYSKEVSCTTIVLLSLLNAVIAMLYTLALIFSPGFFDLPNDAGLTLGGLLFIATIALFIGAILIKCEKYKAGAVFSAIGGVITLPIGLLGIFAAQKAWRKSKQHTNSISPVGNKPTFANISYPPTQPMDTSITPISVCCPHCNNTFQIIPTAKPFKVKCPKCSKISLLR